MPRAILPRDFATVHDTPPQLHYTAGVPLVIHLRVQVLQVPTPVND